MPATVNPDLSRIWDEAETYVIPRASVPGGDISPYIPASVNEEPNPLWEFVGLLDASAGIPVNPELEINHFDGFGHPRYRSKARKGALSTGFTALEDNSVTRKFVLPGSASNRIGAPKGLYFYVMYILRDEDIVTDIRVTLRPALFELTGHSGAVEGEQETYEITCHHANDASGDVFARVTEAAELAIADTTIPPGVVGTAYSHQLTAAGGTGDKTWSKTGTLPTGLTLSAAGLLSGTPTAAGTPNITFKVTDSSEPPNEATKALVVTVATP